MSMISNTLGRLFFCYKHTHVRRCYPSTSNDLLGFLLGFFLGCFFSVSFYFDIFVHILKANIERLHSPSFSTRSKASRYFLRLTLPAHPCSSNWNGSSGHTSPNDFKD